MSLLSLKINLPYFETPDLRTISPRVSDACEDNDDPTFVNLAAQRVVARKLKISGCRFASLVGERIENEPPRGCSLGTSVERHTLFQFNSSEQFSV